MDARLVRAYLDALPDVPSDARSAERVRFCLAALGNPDVRYLVASVLGPDAPAVARVASAVLRAAGAPTAVFASTLEATTLDGAPMDDALLARAGTEAASAGYQLADAGVDRGELTRHEAEVILALVAFAEAGQRVGLIVDEAVRPDDVVHVPRADLVVIGRAEGSALDRALALIPDGRPAVLGELADDVRARVEARGTEMGTPMLIGGRDHRLEERGGRLVFLVRGEPYVTFEAAPPVDRTSLSTGIAAALALGVMGIRMREEWVIEGVASLGAAAVAS